MDAHLRRWQVQDADDLAAALRADPELVRQTGELGSAADHIRRTLLCDDTRVVRAVVLDGRVVGSVAVTAIEHRHGTGWTSYWLAPAARGLGLATRGLATVAALAFAEGVVRLELGHRVNNPASCRVATAAGFAAEGIERARLRYGAERFDVETHARLATDPVPAVEPLPLR
ncbi:GNAT family N-acetyltransferase [Cellulomonas denverensis]|uniref:GNAT family N-acetyltransferase n=1 Tax=Cellulomonas denverensis TaxID=264297 RepID=A0A7X6KXP6_9CELL|nr:GNAT family N-acetyltransferase [Cellulomonas denverensis]